MGEQKEGSKEVTQEEPKKSFSLGKLKPFAIGAAILIFIGVLYVLYTTLPSGNLPPNTTITGDLAVLNPSDLTILSGWTLSKETGFADVSEATKKVFLASGVTDMATWQFTRGAETLTLQVFSFDSAENFNTTEKKLTASFGNIQYFADVGNVKGIIGAYKISGSNSPLALYFSQNNTAFLLTYYNQNGVYNSTSYKDDSQFMRYVGERTLEKLG